MSSKAKGIISIILIAGLLALLWLVVPKNTSNEGATGIIKTPDDAEVYINDKKVGDSVNLEVGKEYHIVGKKSGWKDYDKKVVFKEYDKNIIVTLEPNSTEARQWLSGRDNQSRIEGAAGENADAYGQYLRKKYPIIDSLSYDSGLFVLTYGYKTPGDDDSFFLQIKSPFGFYSDGITKIYSLGFDPADYKVEFDETYTNPFKEVEQ